MNSQMRNADNEKRFCLHAMSWSAVITGGLIGAGISFIFNLFVLSIGLTAFATTNSGGNSIAVGGMIGLILIAIFSMGTAGWVAGYLGRPRSLHRDIGVIHGFAAWCVAFVLMVSLSGHVVNFISYNITALHTPTYIVTNVNQHATNLHMTNNNATKAVGAIHDQVVVDTQDATKALAMSTFVLFVILFVGALASCLGGHWGSRSCERDVVYYKDKYPLI